MPKTRISSSLKLITFGAFVSAALVACSDDPQPVTMFPGSSGSGSTAGTPSTGGTFGSTAGTGPVGVSGTSFGTAGTPATAGAGGAGTAGAATGGTGGAGTAGAGTAGTGVVIPQEPFCKDKTLEAFPYNVSSAFYPSGWYPDGKQVEAPMEGVLGDACGAGRIAGAVGGCTAWRYKPAATATWAAVGWVNSDGNGFTHAPVCLGEGATALTFLARGVKGGEKLSIGGFSIDPEQIITLTAGWKRFSIPLTGVTYNSFESGVKSGFSWKVDPVALPEVQPTVEFFIDDIQVVKGDLPPDPSGDGGAGSGGAGDQ